MTHFLKELYRKFAVFGGALALMAVTTGAGYEPADWGQAWMPTSLRPAPALMTCEPQERNWLAPFKLKGKNECQVTSTATAEREQLDSESTENIF